MQWTAIMTQYKNKQCRWGISNTHELLLYVGRCVTEKVTCLCITGGNCFSQCCSPQWKVLERPGTFPNIIALVALTSPALKCAEGSFSMVGQYLTRRGPSSGYYKRLHRYRASRLAGWKHPGWRLLGLPVRRAASSFPRFADREQIQTCRVWTRVCFGIFMKMEVFQAKDHYILQSGDNALWCSRKDGSMAVRPGNAFISVPSLCIVHVLRSYIRRLHRCHSWRVVPGHDAASKVICTPSGEWDLWTCYEVKK